MILNKKNYSRYNVLVIGDSCTDVFQYGEINRLCPEAPVPVFTPSYKMENPGMAANVVSNLKAIGVNTFLISNKEPIIKTRLIDERSNQMITRIDENDKSSRIQNLLEIKNNKFNEIHMDAIIISDYNKGFLLPEDIEYICNHNTNVFIDTKKILGKWCLNSSFIKINNFEFENTISTIDELNIENKLIVTYRDKGARYLDEWFPVEKVQIKDVSGAGDTFLSGLVVEFISTNDIKKSIVFAQECATIVVQKKGVATI